MAEHIKKSLVVATLNMHHGRGTDGKLDLPRIADVITSTEPNIVFLQELDRYAEARSEGVDQPEEIASLINKRLEQTPGHSPMEYLFQVNKTWPDEKYKGNPRQYGTAVLSDLPPVDGTEEHIELPTPEQEGRGLLSVNVQGAEDLQIRLAGTHLTPVQRNKLGIPQFHWNTRRKQVQKIAKHLDGVSPLIVGGDLNAGRGSWTLSGLRAVATDSYLLANETSGECTTRQIGGRPFALDQIHVAGFNVLKAWTAPSQGASDHDCYAVKLTW